MRGQYSAVGLELALLRAGLVNPSKSVYKAQCLDLAKGSCVGPPRNSQEGVAAVCITREQTGTVIGLVAGYLDQ